MKCELCQKNKSSVEKRATMSGKKLCCFKCHKIGLITALISIPFLLIIYAIASIKYSIEGNFKK
jgi:hypothetical protein